MPIFDSWVSRCIELPNLVTPTRETSPWHDQWLDLSSGVATIGQRCKRGQRVTSATSNFQDLTLPKTKKGRCWVKGVSKFTGFFSPTHSSQRVLTFIIWKSLLVFCPKFSLTWHWGNSPTLNGKHICTSIFFFLSRHLCGIPNCSRWQQEETGTAKDRSQ